MKKVYIAIAFVLALVLVAAAGASASAFFPLMEVRRHALYTLNGPVVRFQVNYFEHDKLPEHCVMVIMDDETGHFDTTLLPLAQCGNGSLVEQ